MNRNNYMSTGEFARLMGVSKHTMFHYDDIKLFSPEIVTDNGYRYYSIYQMETFNTILLLKDLGMSLQDIKELLDHRSAKTFIELLQNREQQIEQEIARLEAVKQWMMQRKRKLMVAQSQDFSEIQIKQYPKRYYLCRKVEDNSDRTFYTKINELVVEFESFSMINDYDIATFQHEEQIEKGICDQYDNTVLLMEQKPPDGTNYDVLPAGEYLVSYHIGHWSTIAKAYERLLAYKKEYHIQTDTEYLEYYIVDNFIAKNMEEYVTEIAVRILG